MAMTRPRLDSRPLTTIELLPPKADLHKIYYSWAADLSTASSQRLLKTARARAPMDAD